MKISMPSLVQSRVRLHPKRRFFLDVYLDRTDRHMYRRVAKMHPDVDRKDDYLALMIMLPMTVGQRNSKSRIPLRVGMMYFSVEGLSTPLIVHECVHVANFGLPILNICLCRLTEEADTQEFFAGLTQSIFARVHKVLAPFQK